MRTTLKDIASRANVSISLVGNVLNDRPGVWASPQTRDRIRAAAKQLNYRPNLAARTLQRGRSNSVAFVYTGSSSSPGSITAQSGIEASAEMLAISGYESKLTVFARQEDTMAALREMARSGAVDMAILWSANAADVAMQAQTASESNLPFVAVGRFEESHPEWPQVDFDHEGMMRQSVEQLWRHGHRRIAFIGHDNDLPYNRALIRGFRDVLGGLSGEMADDEMILQVAEWYETPGRISAAIHRWMTGPNTERPIAIVMGVGGAVWKDVEVSLLEHHRFIGFGPDEVEVTGLRYHNAGLMFGNAMAHSSIDEATLAQAMIEKLVLPTLRGETLPERVVRLLPEMAPLRDPAFNVEQRERTIRFG